MTGSEENHTGIDPSGPLAGVRVLALEQAVAGPLCTRHLADLGADVIKIERPGGGDFARRYDTAVKGLSSYFFWLNRGKRSLTLDMKHPGANDDPGAAGRVVRRPGAEPRARARSTGSVSRLSGCGATIPPW